MFSLPLTKIKKPLSVLRFDNPEDELIPIYEYTKIGFIYCEISNPTDYASPEPLQKLQVLEIGMPGGSASFIKSLLTERITIMADEIKKYLEGTDDFESIVARLKRCVELCKKAARENNTENAFTFSEEIEFNVNTPEGLRPVLPQYLNYSKIADADFQEHFDIRKNFYLELVEKFSEAYEWHLQKPDPTKKPYSWDSKTAELDASELIYLLCKKSELIKINVELGGSFAKFRKEFFGLFCLSGKRYDQNVTEILKRQKDKHFIDRLAGLMPNTAPEPPIKK